MTADSGASLKYVDLYSDVTASGGVFLTSVNVRGSATLTVNGASANTIRALSGQIVVNSGASVTRLGLNDSFLTVTSGASVTRLTLFDSIATVSSGAVVQRAFVAPGGQVTARGGSVISATVKGNGGRVAIVGVDSGGTVSAVSVQQLGLLFVGSGGLASGINDKGGIVNVYAGGTARSVRITASGTLTAQSGATVTNTVVNGGTEKVLIGAVMRGTVWFGANGGSLVIAQLLARPVIKGFTAGDTIDLRSFKIARETHSFVENGAGTKGVLTVDEGGFRAKITLFGQYTAAGFNFADDGTGGTAITYSAPTSAHVASLAVHG